MKAARRPERGELIEGFFHAATPDPGCRSHRERVRQDSAKRCGKTTFSHLPHSVAVTPYTSDSPAPMQQNRGGR